MKKWVGMIGVSLALIAGAQAGGRCNVDYNFRITDTSGNPLEGVSVSYIVKGGRQDATRHYSKYKSSDRWSKKGSFGNNLKLNLGILEFRGDVISVELRFTKDGYKMISRTDRIKASEGFHGPILRIEMTKDKRHQGRSSNQSSSSSRSSNRSGFYCMDCDSKLIGTGNSAYYCPSCRLGKCDRCGGTHRQPYMVASGSRLIKEENSFYCKGCAR